MDKLLKTRDQSLRTIVHPLYQLFPTRLELKYYDEIKTEDISYDFKSKLKENLEVNGLLCPMIIDQNNNLKKSINRFMVVKKFSDASVSISFKKELKNNLLNLRSDRIYLFYFFFSCLDFLPSSLRR